MVSYFTTRFSQFCSKHYVKNKNYTQIKTLGEISKCFYFAKLTVTGN